MIYEVLLEVTSLLVWAILWIALATYASDTEKDKQAAKVVVPFLFFVFLVLLLSKWAIRVGVTA